MTGAYEEYKSLMTRGRFRDAAALARAQSAAVSAGRDLAFWLTREAAASSRAGDHEAALATARRALEADGADLYAVYAAAEALTGLGRHAEALKHFDEAAREPRLESRARKRILECLQAERDWEGLLVRLASSGLPEEDALGFEAAALAGLGRAAEALAKCRRRLEIKPHHPPAVWQLVELEVASDGVEPVLERYRRMARIPSLPQVYREVHASLARRAGKTDEAIRAYETLDAAGGGSRGQRQLSFTLAKSGREAEAIPLIEELLREDPKDVYLHSSYGAACKRAGELERAVSFYNTLIGLHPEERGLYGRLSRLRRALEEKT